jgi:hypothetical protein
MRHSATTDMSHSLIPAVRSILGMLISCDGASSLPTLLIDHAEHSKLSAYPAAERAMSYLNDAGFDCDRTRMNLYGFPGLLRDLASPPPWLYVEMEDVVGEISSERATDLRPLFDYIHDTDATKLAALFDEWRQDLRASRKFLHSEVGDSMPSRETSLALEAAASESFSRLTALGQAIAPSEFCGIWNAVFGFDEFTLSPGVPDLLVWLPKASPGCWFFVEVKAHGDYLSHAQKEWLRSNLNVVRGHYLLVLLE